MDKNLKFYLFSFFLLISNSIVTYTMKRSCETEIPPVICINNKKQKTEHDSSSIVEQTPVAATSKIENELKISHAINSEKLKQSIITACETYKNKITALEASTLKNFQEDCGLTPENWNFFEQKIKILPYYKKNFSSAPKNFKQQITPDIPQDNIERLKNNLIQNDICFNKINICNSKEISTFLIHNPLYRRSTKNPTQFIFQPDILTINYDRYKKDQDFFNVCIVAAFTQEIMKIQHIFRLIFQYQITQQICTETSNLRCFNFCFLFQEYSYLKELLNTFIRDYGFKIGILHLALKNAGIAHLFKHYLITNKALCSEYGITENELSFFQNIEKIDVLKYKLQNIQLSDEKDEKDYLDFIKTNELNPENLSS